MGFYDNYVLPIIIDCGCGMKEMQEQRRAVVPEARGRVLEIGIGSGHNLGFYDPARVERVIGIEPSERLLDKARRRGREVPFPVEFLSQGAEEIPLPDESVDTVLVTFTLCTIPAVEDALAQMRRVLKRDGQLIFCEHGRAPEASLQRWQDRINPLWKKLFGGCHINRDMPELLSAAGFRIERLEAGYMDGAPRIAGYRYRGFARARH